MPIISIATPSGTGRDLKLWIEAAGEIEGRLLARRWTQAGEAARAAT